MNPSQFLLILRARKRILLLTLLLTVAATLAISLILPKTYQASSTLLLNYKGIDPLTGMTMPGQLLPGYIATQIDIIGSKNVALRVVDQLELAKNPAVVAQFNDATGGRGAPRDWLADALLKRLDVVPSRESSVVEVSFKGSDPRFAAAVANAFADQYQRVSVALKSDPMRRIAAYYDAQARTLRDDLERAQSRLSKYQQDNGIVSVDSRLDVESNRLNDLSTQLVAAQGQASEAAARRRLAQGGAPAQSPDIASNPLIQNLRVGLGGAEARLAELGQRLAPNHPQYRSAKAEADKLRRDLGEQIGLLSRGVGDNARILGQHEGAIRVELAAQKARVLQLNRARDEAGVLARDVENAQRAFDVAAQRLAQTRIEGQAEQSDIAVLNPAVAPIEAASPRVLLNTALALFLGAMLGLGFCLLAEMLDRRVRGATDLSELLGIPVLGVIAWRAPGGRRPGMLGALLARRLRVN